MNITVSSKGIEDNELASKFREHLSAALSRFEDKISKIDSRLEKNSHGANEICHINVYIKQKKKDNVITITETSNNINESIEVAINRLKIVIAERVSKMKHGIGGGRIKSRKIDFFK